MSASSSTGPSGVLSDGEITRLSDELVQPLIDDLEPKQLRPAGYDVAIAATELTTPDGTRYEGSERFPDRYLILEPGDTAEFSSRERLALPPNITGTLGVKTHLARNGLLLLTGNVIDPGYDGKLHFYVANVGGGRIILEPDKTPVAAVQFAYVCGDRHPERDDEVAPPKPARNRSLGFVAVLRDIKNGYDDMKEDVERNRSLTENVLMLGYFVLAATLLSMTLDHLLSIGGNGELIDRVNAAVPDTTDGKVLMGVLALSIAWIVYSLAVVLPHRRRPRPDPADESDLYRRQAIYEARRKQAFAWLRLAALAVPAASVFAFALTEIDWTYEAWLSPTVAAAIVAGFGFLMVRWIKPLQARDIARRARQLAEEGED